MAQTIHVESRISSMRSKSMATFSGLPSPNAERPRLFLNMAVVVCPLTLFMRFRFLNPLQETSSVEVTTVGGIPSYCLGQKEPPGFVLRNLTSVTKQQRMPVHFAARNAVPHKPRPVTDKYKATTKKQEDTSGCNWGFTLRATWRKRTCFCVVC